MANRWLFWPFGMEGKRDIELSAVGRGGGPSHSSASRTNGVPGFAGIGEASCAAPVYAESMARKPRALRKITDFEGQVRCASGTKGVLREEVYVNEAGEVVKYNLAFIHFGLFQKDDGRVVGYDNAHGHHERHWMGTAEPVPFASYDVTVQRFLTEVEELKEGA